MFLFSFGEVNALSNISNATNKIFYLIYSNDKPSPPTTATLKLKVVFVAKSALFGTPLVICAVANHH
jgi:hypothetical protein